MRGEEEGAEAGDLLTEALRRLRYAVGFFCVIEQLVQLIQILSHLRKS